MELQFQKQQKRGLSSATKQGTTFRNRGANKSKFVGVRQRPSGKWVAEIKNTTQKIRMWLGTFDTAEEAARAYDEAACLLRGSNTRTNFVNQGPPNSPLSLKIRNLLNQKKANKQSLSTTTTSTTNIEATTKSTIGCHTTTSISTSTSSPVMSDDVYKPDLSNCCSSIVNFDGGLEMGCAQFEQPFRAEFEFEVPKRIGWVPQPHEMMSEADQIPEFERMKVERQISASLYAMNGVSEYWENVLDSSDAFWDLPTLSQMFCPS